MRYILTFILFTVSAYSQNLYYGTFTGDGTGLSNVVATPGTNVNTNNASQLTSGTLADALLSANVPLLNAANVFTAASNRFSTIGAQYIYPMGSSSTPTITTNFGAFQAGLFIAGNDDRMHIQLPLTATAPAANTKLFTVNFGTTAPKAPFDVQFSAASISGVSLPAIAGVNMAIRLYATNFSTSGYDVWVGSTALTGTTTNVILLKTVW